MTNEYALSRGDGKTAIVWAEKIERLCFADCWSADAIRGSLENNGSICYFCELGGEAAGYVIGAVSLDECELYRIAVLPEKRRAGIAAKLFAAFEAECRQRGVKRILLEVKSQNSAAIAFYEKSGFCKIAERKGYYSDDNAVIYEMLLLPHAEAAENILNHGVTDLFPR